MTGKRIDYYDDPNAPAANSMVPSVNVVIENDAGEILMIQRSDNGNWAVPGGAIDPKHIIFYTSNGEARQEFSILLRGRATGGQATTSSESTQVHWVPQADLHRSKWTDRCNAGSPSTSTPPQRRTSTRPR